MHVLLTFFVLHNHYCTRFASRDPGSSGRVWSKRTKLSKLRTPGKGRLPEAQASPYLAYRQSYSSRSVAYLRGAIIDSLRETLSPSTDGGVRFH